MTCISATSKQLQKNWQVNRQGGREVGRKEESIQLAVWFRKNLQDLGMTACEDLEK